MKKRLLFLSLLGLAIDTYAQEPADVLKYSFQPISGTARHQAIGGAMGSLGGEFTTQFVNPAGLGFYQTNEFVLSGGFNHLSTKANYLNNTDKSTNAQVKLGTAGWVFGSTHRKKDRNLGKAIAIGINRIADFNQDSRFSGTNNFSSYSERYIEELFYNNETNPNSAANNYPFGSSLAFNTYLIDTTNNAAGFFNGYKSIPFEAVIAKGGSLLQQQFSNRNGYFYEASIAYGKQTSEAFYWGVGLGIPFSKMEQTTQFIESDATNNPNNGFKDATITDRFTSKGVGVNFKLGAIFKPAEFIRFGLTVHTPSFMTFRDEFATTIQTNTENFQGNLQQSTEDLRNGAPGTSEYSLSIPWKAIGSISYVFREVADTRKQKGFITADVEYVGHNSARYNVINSDNFINDGSEQAYFDQLNDVIKDELKGAINFRLGGELKFNTWMVRAGGGYYGNPYNNGFDKASRLQLSGGLGYRNKGKFVDLTYVYNRLNDVNYPYRLQDNVFNAANLNQSIGNVVLTFGLKF